MTALLLPIPFLTAFDNEGHPVANARLYLYLTTGTNNATAYTTPALSTPHDQPIVADSAGRFPAIYLQHGTVYRAVLRDADGATLADIDPINPDGPTIGTDDLEDEAVTADKCAPGLLAALQGFPAAVNRAGDTMQGGLHLDTTLSTLSDDLAGYLGSPVNDRNDSFTLGLGDAGRTIRHSSGTAHDHTVPAHASVPFPVGTVIGFRNVGAGTQTIASDAEVVVIKEKGTGTGQEAWQVAQHGEAWIIKDATGTGGSPDVWYISGLGVT